MANLLDSIGKALLGAGKDLVGTLQIKGEELAKEVEKHSIEVAKDIRRYNQLILETLDKRLRKEISASDANISIKTWKTATKSAVKKLQQQALWEAHDMFWLNVGNVFKFAALILGEIVL